jgi:flagellar hook assembly protein FlgD
LVGINKLTFQNNYLNIYPNPFLTSARLEYSLSQNSDITIEIYDMSGKVISNLLKKRQSAGKYTIDFDGSEIPTGVYYCMLKTGNQVMTKKIIKVR